MHNYLHDALLEVATEGFGLMVLDLSVLHGAAPQVVIQLCGIDGCTALLVLGGVLPDPEVDVLGEETAHSPGLGCSQRDQIRDQLTCPLLLAPLVREECSIQWLCLWEAPDLSPSLQTCCVAQVLAAPIPPHIWGKFTHYCSQNIWRAMGTFSNLDRRLTLLRPCTYTAGTVLICPSCGFVITAHV